MVNNSMPVGLLDSVSNGECALFVGAGLSMGSGLPGWPGLMKPVADQIDFPWPHNDNLTSELFLTVAQYYENSHGRNNLIRFLQNQLDDTKVKPSEAHLALGSLPVRTIFTTNYDSLLEKAYSLKGIRTNNLISEEDLAYWQENTVQIIKLCGDIRRPNSMVVTKQDFNLYASTHPRLVERLRSILESRVVLFLGYSMRDPFLNQIWDIIGYSFGRNRRMGFLTLFESSDLELRDLEKRGVFVIKLPANGDRTEVLKDWLNDLTLELKPPPNAAL